MYKILYSLLCLLVITGCTATPRRLTASVWETIAYGDYYLKQQPPDGVRALALYERAAKDGNKWAQEKAGELLLSGRAGAPKDQSKAIEYFKLSSSQGVGWASYNLAMAYKAGLGVNVDKAEAIRLARLARSQAGRPIEAMNLLLYDLLKDANPTEANHYLVEASDAGIKKAQDLLSQRSNQ